MQNFEKDLQFGEQFEQLILQKIQKKYPKAYKVEGYHKEYDLYVNEKITIEIKVDNQTIKTNNILVESQCNGKKSGITTTKASHWCFITHQNVIWVTTKKLKELLKKNSESYYCIQGDWQAKRGYFIPYDELLTIAHHYPTPANYTSLMPPIITQEQKNKRIKELLN
ncbi:hypothetical protein [Galbibacter pacificus]|uniref:Restriction endonuclease n=1 Tax=Galbibacter pacificus TaxID=2996052 RepID=A0ABT6FR63_9FLAO|nr:hypothetical protein [Galbibacter pacificus]MDG3581775.1 hypothetical protein [Galbibacter pacificus]MDG3585751.1 hypothetical protein [Galbibacter pacificus]